MEPISVCVIARNEDNHIEECLKRLRPCKFEVIVVDTGSIDRTKELAAKYTDKIFDFEWCKDFSAARNFSISKASNDWILVIDCDEYLENVNLLDIGRLSKENPEKVGLIQRNNPYTIQGSKSIMTERLGRFFNRKHCHFEGNIHERVVLKDGTLPEEYEIPLTIYHEGYVAESDKRTKATRNLEMLLVDVKENGGDAFKYYQLGQNYVSMNDIEKAVSYFEMGLELDCNPKDTYTQSMLEAYAYCLIAMDLHPKGLELFDKYYESFCHRADYLYVTGVLCMKERKFDRALEEFEKATTIKVYNRSGTSDYRAYYQMGCVKELMGDKVAAKQYFSKCGDFMLATAKLEALKYVQ